MQEWRNIIGFIGYSVSDMGNIRNDDTGRIMKTSFNGRGFEVVGLMHRGIQYKRSVTVLVASAFVTTARSLSFNTPINLNGDRRNNRASNLMWRPRWFAVKYFQQFLTGPQGFGRAIQEMKTGELFETSWDAAIKYGILDREIAIAIMTHTYVWPTYQMFRVLEI